MSPEKKNLSLLAGALQRVEAMGDEEFGGLARRVAGLVNEAAQKARKIARPYMGLRFLLLVVVLLLLGGGGYLAWQGWENLAGYSLDQITVLLRALLRDWGAAALALAPFAASFLFYEAKLRRRRFMAELCQVETAIDDVYDIQFDKNAYPTSTGAEREAAWCIEYIDVCIALLLALRRAASSYAKVSTDKAVLDRVAAIRRGASAQHLNLLTKLTQLQQVWKGAAQASASA